MARTDPTNATRYWWDRHIAGLSLLRADFTTHEYRPHFHEALVIAVTEQGGAVIKSRGVADPYHAGTLFVSNPAEPQSAWMGSSPRWRYRSFYLTRRAMDEVARGLGIAGMPGLTRNMFNDTDLSHGFLALHRALEHGEDAFGATERLIDACGLLVRRHGRGSRLPAMQRDHRLFDRAVAVMQERRTEILHLDTVADAVGLTSFQLIGLFRRSAGLTPHAYLTQIRLAAACRELLDGQPIAEAASAAGFYDQSALTRHFKRCYAITPLQFVAASRDTQMIPSI